MERLTQNTQVLDLPLLEGVVGVVYKGQSFLTSPAGAALNESHQRRQSMTEEVRQAQSFLTTYKAEPEVWHHVDHILEHSTCPYTRFFALQLLDEVVVHRWHQIPANQREAIRSFVSNFIVSISSALDSSSAEKSVKTMLNKANVVLVHILKHEWPDHWSSFTQDLISSMEGAARTPGLCENNFQILSLLSEEVFNYENATMTQRMAERKKQALLQEYAQIMTTGLDALENSEDPRVLTSALQMLERYLSWVPPESLSSTPLVSLLGSRFLPVGLTRNSALRCLTEISSSSASSSSSSSGSTFSASTDAHHHHHQQQQMVLTLYRGVMRHVATLYPPDSAPSLLQTLHHAHESGSEEQRDFLHNLSLFLISLFTNHAGWLEAVPEETLGGHMYLVALTRLEDKENFKVCVEYWLHLCKRVYAEMHSATQNTHQRGEEGGPGGWGTFSFAQKRHQGRALLYREVFTALLPVLTGSMAKPEEVIIVEDEQGELTKEYLTDVETIDLYNTMRQTLVLLAHLNLKQIETLLLDNLEHIHFLARLDDNVVPERSAPQGTGEEEFGGQQPSDTEWTWRELNQLCWTVGAISGTMEEAHERTFFIRVIRILLELCDVTSGKENRAVIASNIMYVVGQYPRFLRSHYRFLTTVMNKLTEFMEETFPGVQDMAVDTFLKLARLCGTNLCEGSQENDFPYVLEFIQTKLPKVLPVLQSSHIYVLFEALGVIVGAAPEPVQEQTFIPELYRVIVSDWDSLVSSLQQGTVNILEPDVLRKLIYLLRCEVCAGKGLGHTFVHHVHNRRENLMDLYGKITSVINEQLKLRDANVIHTYPMKLLRGVRREILKVFAELCSSTRMPEPVARYLLPLVFDTILPEYKSSLPALRDAQLLTLLTTICERLRIFVGDNVSEICASAVEPTLQMISENMQDYPDHRVQVFKLMRALTKNCFDPFLRYAQESPMIMDGVLWSMKHTTSAVSGPGAEMLLEFLYRVSQSPLAAPFYVAYAITILTEVMVAMTDTLHKGDFAQHVKIIALILQVAPGAARIAADQDPETSSLGYIQQYLTTTLSTAFPNLTFTQVDRFVTALCGSHGTNLPALTALLRDFVIELKEWGPRDAQELALPGGSSSSSPNRGGEGGSPEVMGSRGETSPLGTAAQRGSAAVPSFLAAVPGFVVEKHSTTYAQQAQGDE